MEQRRAEMGEESRRRITTPLRRKGKPMEQSDLQVKTEAFQRAELEKLLAQCTEKQRALFHRIYPRGVPAKSLIAAYDVCLRTILKTAA